MKKYLTIKEASELFGVTPLTLRNWDRNGKLLASRNPINNYRMYRREDIEELLGEMEQRTSKYSGDKSTPRENQPGVASPRATQEEKTQIKKLNVRFIEDEA